MATRLAEKKKFQIQGEILSQKNKVESGRDDALYCPLTSMYVHAPVYICTDNFLSPPPLLLTLPFTYHRKILQVQGEIPSQKVESDRG